MNDDSGSGPSGPSNVLLQRREGGECEESACMELLGVEEPSNVDVLFVTFTKSAADRLEVLKRHADGPPTNVGVVSVEVSRSNGDDRVGGPDGPRIRSISDPSDLTGVGIAISEFLSAWSGNGNRTVVCFESLTALLQYVDASRVFQFCNEITSKFEAAGARAHFHITPGAHERQELSVLSSLFDARVDPADLAGDPEAAETAERTTDAGDDDPFEYAVADTDDGSEGDMSTEGDDATDDATGDAADDVSVATDDTESPAGTGESGTDAGGSDVGGRDAGETDDVPSEDDPADLVSSVIAGEADGEDDAPSLDADIPDLDGSDDPSDDPDPADDADLDATSRRTEREELRRRLEHIGPGASRPERPAVDTGDDGTATDDGDEAPGRFDKYTFFQRTTATVVGVVVMLVLISFLSAAMPVPVGPDAPTDDGGDLTPTATADEVAVADSTDDGTTATPTPDPTATPTPDPTPTPTSDSSSSSSSSSSSGSTGGSSTETPTETSTPTSTETPTDDDDLTDVLDTDDDGDLL